MPDEVFSGEDRTIITATTNVKASRGRIVKLIAITAIAGQVDVYDHPSADNNKIWGKASVAEGDIYVLDCPMQNGIRVKTGAAGTLCVIWS